MQHNGTAIFEATGAIEATGTIEATGAVESSGVIEANGSAVAPATVEEFARFRSHAEGESASQSLNLRDWLDLAEAWRIMQALHACQGNRSAAARALGIGRRTLYAKMEKLGITPTWRFGDPTARQSPASFAKP